VTENNGEYCEKFWGISYRNWLKNDIILSCDNKTSSACYWKAALYSIPAAKKQGGLFHFYKITLIHPVFLVKARS
jgi:hypothetical protein